MGRISMKQFVDIVVGLAADAKKRWDMETRPKTVAFVVYGDGSSAVQWAPRLNVDGKDGNVFTVPRDGLITNFVLCHVDEGRTSGTGFMREPSPVIEGQKLWVDEKGRTVNIE